MSQQPLPQRRLRQHPQLQQLLVGRGGPHPPQVPSPVVSLPLQQQLRWLQLQQPAQGVAFLALHVTRVNSLSVHALRCWWGAWGSLAVCLQLPELLRVAAWWPVMHAEVVYPR
jgi:hypothetical protein